MVSFGYGGIPENVLFPGITVLNVRKKHIPNNQASIQNASVAKNVQCGRNYICFLKCHFVVFFTKICWTISQIHIESMKNTNIHRSVMERSIYNVKCLD